MRGKGNHSPPPPSDNPEFHGQLQVLEINDETVAIFFRARVGDRSLHGEERCGGIEALCSARLEKQLTVLKRRTQLGRIGAWENKSGGDGIRDHHGEELVCRLGQQLRVLPEDAL
jgi:hypothetical protein